MLVQKRLVVVLWVSCVKIFLSKSKGLCEVWLQQLALKQINVLYPSSITFHLPVCPSQVTTPH